MKTIKYIVILYFFTININAQIIPELSKTSIDYGDRASCEIVTDTIIIRNPSTSTQSFKLLSGEKLIGSPCFRIINPKIKDLDLPPYDGTNAVIYVIEFNAKIASIGNNSGTLIINTDLVDYPSIEIPVSANMLISDYDFSDLNFGNIGVGVNITADLMLHIISPFPTRIKSISNSKSELTADLTDFNYQISSNDTLLSINYNIILSSAQVFRDTIIIEIDSPCDTILYIPVSAISIESDLEFISSINLGALSQCSIKDTTIVFEYTGLAQARINSIGLISGNDNSGSLFTATFSQNFPIILNNSNKSVNLTITFQSNKAFEGMYNVIIPINVTLDGIDYTLNVSLTVVVEGYHITSNENIIDFGLTYTNNPVLKNFIISNTGSTNVEFIGYQFINNPANSVNFASPFVQFTLNSLRSDTLDLIFDPQISDIVLDGYLILYYEFKGCQDSILISLKGQSISKKYIDFSIKAGIFSPNDVTGRLKVYMSSESDIDLPNETVRVTISFFRDLFFPKNIITNNNSKIISNFIDNDNRIIIIETNIPKIKKIDSVFNLLFEIEGDILLGNHTKTPVIIDSIKFLTPNFFEIGTISNDTLSIIICQAGGDRLLQVVNNGLSISQTFLKNQNDVLFDIHTIEKGKYHLAIYDYLGSVVKSIEFHAEKDKQYEFRIQDNIFNNSLYFYILQSPSEIKQGKFIKIN